ncbi:hypothetical protein [Amycolatopsis methanolica]|uniref:hypothetical protein n=1 Tax=Amycolatopsis methanolica TaxID=1814 RepID=UPI0034265F32
MSGASAGGLSGPGRKPWLNNTSVPFQPAGTSTIQVAPFGSVPVIRVAALAGAAGRTTASTSASRAIPARYTPTSSELPEAVKIAVATTGARPPPTTLPSW